jgi:hypothetical protein
MMNREVMSRQMFAKGGAAFPDLSGDGNVTQKDILIGRGVIEKQEGGMVPMPAPAAPGPQMSIPAIDPNSVDINQAAQGAMQNGIDPAMLEGMLTQYAQGMDDLENAEDYETVMNGIRGDDQPIEQRYQELASVVGQEDAQQTPESVLALVQPVMMMAAVDQGIGGLAAAEMNAPIEGAMAEGIMSTVNMGGPNQAQGGPAPVNFNQGGAVQYMEPGGVALPQSNRFQTLFDQSLTMFDQVNDPVAREAALEEQRNMTKAGILFDIAQGALSFAGGAGRPGATPAEQLATAFTPVVGNIGARAGELNKLKQAQAAEDRQLRLGALQMAGQQYAAEQSKPEATIKGVPMSVYNEMSEEDQRTLLLGRESTKPIIMPKGAILVDDKGKELASNLSQEDETFILGKGQQLLDSKGAVIAENKGGKDENIYSIGGQLVRFNPETQKAEVIFAEDKRQLITVDGTLLLVDPNAAPGEKPVELYESAKNTKPQWRTLRDNVKGIVTYIDISTKDGQEAMALASAGNLDSETSRYTIGTIPADQTPKAQAYRIEGVGTRLSYDGGRTYLTQGPDGPEIVAMKGDEQPLSDTIAADIAANQRIQLMAGNQLEMMDDQLGIVVKGGTKDNPTSVSTEDTKILRDAMKAARNGTGPYAAFNVFLDRTFGGAIPAAREAFQDTQQNRQFLRGLMILGRSALVVNPRFPVAEMEKVATLFPDPDLVFSNPETEANKLVELKNLALTQKRNNLQQLSLGIQDAGTRQAVMANNFEIDRLLNLLGTVPTGTTGGAVDPDKVEALQGLIQRNR